MRCAGAGTGTGGLKCFRGLVGLLAWPGVISRYHRLTTYRCYRGASELKAGFACGICEVRGLKSVRLQAEAWGCVDPQFPFCWSGSPHGDPRARDLGVVHGKKY